MAALGTMSTGLAHELNNPLFLIQGFASELLDQMKSLGAIVGERTIDFLTEIKTNADRMKQLIKSFKEFGHRSHTGFEKIEVQNAIMNAVNILEKQLKLLEIEIEIKIEDNLYVHAVPGRLEQLLINLLANSKDAIEDQNGSSLYSLISNCRGEISILSEVVNDEIAITVSDTGIGISNDVMKKIFDPFFSTKSVSKGTGLGLSITHTIIEEMKGRVEIKSEEDIGTSFTLYFPTRFKG